MSYIDQDEGSGGYVEDDFWADSWPEDLPDDRQDERIWAMGEGEWERL